MTPEQAAGLVEAVQKALDRAALRAWLDRKPPSRAATGVPRSHWWFANGDGDYIGERSARTGPDDVNAAQRCACEVCAQSSQAADATQLQKGRHVR